MSSEDSQGLTDFLYTLGQINTNIEWLKEKVDDVDRKVSNDKEKIDEWKLIVEESVTNLKSCAKTLKEDGEKIDRWRDSMDSRIKVMEEWANKQKGAQNTMRYLGTGLASGLVVFILTKIWPIGG